jgi:hypothetical protein
LRDLVDDSISDGQLQQLISYGEEAAQHVEEIGRSGFFVSFFGPRSTKARIV